MTGRMAASRSNGWLAIPLLAAVAMAGWLAFSSTRGTLDAGGDDVEAAAGGGAPAEAGVEGGTLAQGAPAKKKPEPAAEGPAAPTFTKAEGVFGRVLDSHEKGIVGAKVALSAVDPSMPWNGPESPTLAETTSGEGGAYLVGPAPAGRLRLRADAPGYAATVLWVSARGSCVDVILDRGGSVRVHARDAQGAPVKGAEIRVTSGMFSARATTGEAGDALVESVPTGQAAMRVSASGRATVNVNDVVVESGKTLDRTCVLGTGLALTGRALDDASGAGLSGVEVSVRSQWDVSAPAPPAATTDVAGRFRIEGAGSAQEWVQVQGMKEGYQPSNSGVMLQAAAEGGAQEVVLKMVRGDGPTPIAGTVLDGEGRGAAGATVVYLGMQRSAGGAVAPRATADASGAFELPLPQGTNKEFGTLQLAASAPGKGVAALQVQSTRTGPTVLRLGGAGTVTGKVTGADGKPLEGAAVTLVYDWSSNQKAPPPGFEQQPWLLQQLLYDTRLVNLASTTDAAGAYRLEGVPASAYRLDAAWGLDRSGASTAVSVRAGATENVDVALGNGKTIQGRVTDGEGTPVAGAYVNGWDPTNREPMNNRQSFARSDAEGAFKLRNVTGDRWQLSVYAAGYASQNVPNVAAGDGAVDVKLVTLGWIEGQVLAEGKPYAGSFHVTAQFTGANESNERRTRFMGGGVSYDGGGQRDEAFSSPDGRFVLRGVLAGPWKVNVTTTDGWIPAASVEVAVSDGRAAGPIEVRLVRGAVLSGVVSEEGVSEPVVGANVSVRIKGAAETGGQTYAWAVTDAKGRYYSAGLAGGTYVVTAQTPAGYSAEEEIRVLAGETLQRDLLALHFGSVTVRVVDSSGKAVEGASVTLTSDRGTVLQPNWDLLQRQKLVDFSKPNSWQRLQQTDEQGVNQRWHLPPGRTSVKVNSPGTGQGGTAVVDVASDRNSEITVTIVAPDSR